MHLSSIRRRTLMLVVGLLATTALAVIPARPAAAASVFTQISAGGTHSCGITPTGAVKCWGNNANGQLGNGTNTASNKPVQVSGLTSGATAITAGDSHSCAVVSGAAKCWGANVSGQLGNGNNTDTTTPVQVTGLTTGTTSISAGTSHSCAIVSGAATCWGSNSSGRLGNGTSTDSNTPVPVTGLTADTTTIAAGGIHTCAIVSGAAKCWGNNASGQLGNGSNTTDSTTPVQVSGLTTGTTTISTGAFHACAIVSGAAKCWGDNSTGRLGNGSITDSNIPVQVTGLTTGTTTITAGGGHTCAIVTGAAKCWGYNFYSQLGNGGDIDAFTPVQVTGLATDTTTITAGKNHSCAIASGASTCWGRNSNGQLGTGTNTNSSVPVSVFGIPDATPAYATIDLISTTSVRVNWTDTSTNETGYLVYRVEGSTQTLVPGCSTTTPNLTQCTDTGLTPGTYYQYYVYAWNTDGTTYPGTYLLTRTPDNKPAAPTIASAVATNTSTATVTWNDGSTNETGFRVYRFVSGTYVLETTTAANATSATFTDASMNTATAQIFVVTAFNASGETYADTYVFSLARSAPTGVLSAPTYAAPSNVTGTTATVNWTDNANNESGYLVYRVLGSTQTLVPGCSISTPNLQSCTDTGLTPGTYYQYHVYAWNSSGNGYPGTGVIVHTPKPLPAPTLTAAFGYSPTNVRLLWTDNATDETGYALYEYVGGNYVLLTTTAPNAAGFNVGLLTPGTLHAYIVATVRGTDITYAPYGIWATTPT